MNKADAYEVHVEYDKTAGSAKVFEQISEFFKSIDNLNDAIAQSFSTNIATNAIIEKISEGSLRVWLVDIITKMPDDKLRGYALDPRTLLGDLLVGLKKSLIFILSGVSKLNNRQKADQAIELVASELEAGELKQMGYKLNKEKLLKAMSGISESASKFAAPPTFVIKGETYKVDSPYIYDPKDLPEIEWRTSVTRSKFRIKKPDLVGDSKWTIIHDKTIEAKILDEDWLKKLRDREFSILSGDSLDADMRTEVYFNRDMLEISETNYFIVKVYSVCPPQKQTVLPI
ncbi:MAG: hypothetical protein LBF86_06990 [Helicobacteraceae bacterium]|jgi:hypothetical protein|nr:hypothetical protein [Helicobacteraceae bacterium]